MGVMIVGIVRHHYGSKALSYTEDKAEAQTQETRGELLNKVNGQLNQIQAKLKDQSAYSHTPSTHLRCVAGVWRGEKHINFES